jgi:hypothetical protein
LLLLWLLLLLRHSALLDDGDILPCHSPVNNTTDIQFTSLIYLQQWVPSCFFPLKNQNKEIPHSKQYSSSQEMSPLQVPLYLPRQSLDLSYLCRTKPLYDLPQITFSLKRKFHKLNITSKQLVTKNNLEFSKTREQHL